MSFGKCGVPQTLPLLPGPLWPSGVKPDRDLSMNQMELDCGLMLNWIAWNRTVFDIETVLTLKWIVWIRTVWLNWIAWNRNVFDIETVLALKWICLN